MYQEHEFLVIEDGIAEGFKPGMERGEVVIPDGVTEIDDEAFIECESLESVVIPKSVVEIREYAFAHCKSLKSVTIHGNVRKIDSWAFWDCAALAEISFCGTVEQWKAVKKAGGWNDYVPAKTVHCADGEAEV